MTKPASRRNTVARMLRKNCLAILVGLALAPTVYAQTPTTTAQYAIPSGDLVQVINQISRSSGVQIVYDIDALRGLKATEVRGNLTLKQALDQALKGSGLVWTRVNATTIAIRKASAVPEAAARGKSAQVNAAGQPEDQEVRELQEVVVTGTHIRGIEKVGSSLVILDREQIEKSGYSRMEDVLKSLLQAAPGQSYGNNLVTAGNAAGNYGGGASVDLRGLGNGTTLVLVDGVRQASSGTAGLFVDVNSIPLAAVDRIEVLLDGASAIYGSDAIGGVVNIITRKDYNGFETRLRYGNYGGDAGEFNASQLGGIAWKTGNATFGYELRKQQALLADDRAFAADSDQRPRGGSNYRTAYNNPGNILSPLTFQPGWAIPSGQDGTGLTSDQLLEGQVNLYNQNEGLALQPEQKIRSFFFNVSQRFGDRLEIYANVRETKNHSISRTDSVGNAYFEVTDTNPYFVPLPAPFDTYESYYMQYSLARDMPFTTESDSRNRVFGLGGKVKLSSDWQLELSANQARESLHYRSTGYNNNILTEALGGYDDPLTPNRDIDNPATGFNPLVDGFFNPYADGSGGNPAIVDAIRFENVLNYHSGTNEVTAEVDGKLATLPGGALRVALGLNNHKEKLDTINAPTVDGFLKLIPLQRNVKAAFAEFAIPLFGAENRRPGIYSLDVSLAARSERYSDFGDTNNPEIGAAWRPVSALRLRATWGTSFRAPPLTYMNPVYNFASGFVLVKTDPMSPTGTSNALFLSGGNPNLKEERSKQWTFGLDFTPERWRGFRASATYHVIDYRDRIARGGTPGREYNALLEPDVWESIITRDPTEEQIAEACANPNIRCSPIPDVIVDLRLRNLARLRERGIDLRVSQDLQMQHGTLGFTFDGVWTLQNKRWASLLSPGVDVVGTVGNVASRRLRLTSEWTQGNFGLTGRINYLPKFRDPVGRRLTGVPRSVDKWITMDLISRYQMPRGNGVLGNFLAGTILQLNIINLFDRDPPFVDTGLGYDGANANPYGRYASLEFVKPW